DLTRRRPIHRGGGSETRTPRPPLHTACGPDAGYPRFQRDPFARDVALGPGFGRIAVITLIRSLPRRTVTRYPPRHSSPSARRFLFAMKGFSYIGSRRMIRSKTSFLVHQLSFLFDPVDSFHTAVHTRMRDSAYCGRSNQSERLHADQSSQSYPDQLTGRLSDCAPTLQGLQVQNCNRSEA